MATKAVKSASAEKKTPRKSVTLDPIKVAIPKKAEEPQTPYRVGLSQESPVDIAYVGGLEFPKNEEVVEPRVDGTTSRFPIAGKIVHLTQKQVERVKKSMESAIIRARGAGWAVTTTDQKHYRSIDSDRHVATYAYMMPVENADIRVHQGTDPVTMI